MVQWNQHWMFESMQEKEEWAGKFGAIGMQEVEKCPNTHIWCATKNCKREDRCIRDPRMGCRMNSIDPIAKKCWYNTQTHCCHLWSPNNQFFLLVSRFSTVSEFTGVQNSFLSQKANTNALGNGFLRGCPHHRTNVLFSFLLNLVLLQKITENSSNTCEEGTSIQQQFSNYHTVTNREHQTRKSQNFVNFPDPRI